LLQYPQVTVEVFDYDFFSAAAHFIHSGRKRTPFFCSYSWCRACNSAIPEKLMALILVTARSGVPTPENTHSGCLVELQNCTPVNLLIVKSSSFIGCLRGSDQLTSACFDFAVASPTGKSSHRFKAAPVVLVLRTAQSFSTSRRPDSRGVSTPRLPAHQSYLRRDCVVELNYQDRVMFYQYDCGDEHNEHWSENESYCPGDFQDKRTSLADQQLPLIDRRGPAAG
jgi:hypothetical protein